MPPPRDDGGRLSGAKRAYKAAAEVGNRREEARWANVIGDILKNRGEYVEALKWLRIDYKISEECLPDKDLLPACQSIGELFLRLLDFENALYYQREHLRLAKLANDLVEQQRATTQLGRTYHEMFMKDDNDYSALHNAKKYFKQSMDLARILKEKPPSNKSSFFKEYIDAHNNIGMLEMDLDNLEEAERFLSKGLRLCEEEEVNEDDDGRSRLHHNLGFVYTELRKWDKAREHIKKDILICKKIGHCVGEAKGYINLGELCYRIQKYEEATLSYQKALDLAKSMEDEDALVDQIHHNIAVAKEAIRVMAEMKKEEQNLKKLNRTLATNTGTSSERKCLLQQMASLDSLIEKSSSINAWSKHTRFAKMKKRIAKELCDKEKLGDSFLTIGESYQKLRNFFKARKWYNRSWETYKLIGNLEGQALAKINIGNVLDSDGDWVGALHAFEEGYRTAVQAKLPSVQISALENMHYSHMMRLDNVEEARKLEQKIHALKQLVDVEPRIQGLDGDICPESETEGDGGPYDYKSDCSGSPGIEHIATSARLVYDNKVQDEPLISPVRSAKKLSKHRLHCEKSLQASPIFLEGPSKSMCRSTDTSQTAVGRKRVRLVLSDNEDEMHDQNKSPRRKQQSYGAKEVSVSNQFPCTEKSVSDAAAAAASVCQDASQAASKFMPNFCGPANLEESACSYKSSSCRDAGSSGTEIRSKSTSESCIRVKMGDALLCIEADSFVPADEPKNETMKAYAACLYYLQLPPERRSSGLLPVIDYLQYDGKAIPTIESVETLRNNVEGDGWIEVSVNGWVHKRLIKLYIDRCNALSETPNMKLLTRLYNLEVSEDEVIVSGCELQDMSIIPLIDTLLAHKTISMIDLSHNMLGNGTMEKLIQVFTSSGQNYGGLVLDLHQNFFGAAALFQICECPILFERLEVLDISGNRLTDASGSYLSTILQKCRALYSLNIERCSITTRTIQKIANALDAGSALSQLSIGYNSPISGNALDSLLRKLVSLGSFSELNLNGIKLNKHAVDRLCELACSCSLSSLMVGSTNIGCDEAVRLTESLFQGSQELIKLDLSSCGMMPQYIDRAKTNLSEFSSLLELNLSGNSVMLQGSNVLASVLASPLCSIKILALQNCCLGLAGVTQILKALEANNSLEELNLAENIKPEEHISSERNITSKESMCAVNSDQRHHGEFHTGNLHEEPLGQEVEFGVDPQFHDLEVADSNDDTAGEEPELHGQELHSDRRTTQELSDAICKARQLQLLDLSDNGITATMVDRLYAAWSGSRKAGVPRLHIKYQLVHFTLEGKNCCGVRVRPCCRRD
ncbi:hypothetical protein Droror1_Dr00021942 [Drosera rotundifolia]